MCGDRWKSSLANNRSFSVRAQMKKDFAIHLVRMKLKAAWLHICFNAGGAAKYKVLPVRAVLCQITE